MPTPMSKRTSLMPRVARPAGLYSIVAASWGAATKAPAMPHCVAVTPSIWSPLVADAWGAAMPSTAAATIRIRLVAVIFPLLVFKVSAHGGLLSHKASAAIGGPASDGYRGAPLDLLDEYVGRFTLAETEHAVARCAPLHYAAHLGTGADEVLLDGKSSHAFQPLFDHFVDARERAERIDVDLVELDIGQQVPFGPAMRGSPHCAIGSHLSVLDHQHGSDALGIAEKLHHDLPRRGVFAEPVVFARHLLELLHEFRRQLRYLVHKFLGHLVFFRGIRRCFLHARVLGGFGVRGMDGGCAEGRGGNDGSDKRLFLGHEISPFQ